MFVVWLGLRQTLKFAKALSGKYQLKVNGSFKGRCDICSELTVKTPEQRLWHRSSAFIANFELGLHPVLIFILVALSR